MRDSQWVGKGITQSPALFKVNEKEKVPKPDHFNQVSVLSAVITQHYRYRLWWPRRMARQFGAKRRIAGGGIQSRRGLKSQGTPNGACSVWVYGGPAKESVQKQIELIEEFVAARK